MNYEDAKAHRDILEANLSKYSKELDSFPKDMMGLTIDRDDVNYRLAKGCFDLWFKELQNFNKYFVKAFKKERALERNIRYGGLK